MDKEYWENYYKHNDQPFQPSEFANYVLNKLDKNSTLVDVGCGNGRDSIFFSRNNIKTVGIDQSENIINSLKKYENNFLKFEQVEIKNFKNKELDYAYCRFLFHSINEEEELMLLKWLYRNIKKNIFIESRTDEDIEKYSDTDHYRRLMNIEQFKTAVDKLGFTIDDENISDSFSIYNKNYNVKDINFDPVLIRLILKP